MFTGQLINLFVEYRNGKKAESSKFMIHIVGSLAEFLIQRDTLSVSFSTLRRSVREAAPCFVSSKFLIDFAVRFITRQFDNLQFA